MVLQVDIQGVDKAIAKVLAKGEGKIKAINAAIHKSGFMLEADIKQSIAGHKSEPRSVDTGNFLRSITTKNKFLESEVSTDVPYAVFLEKGTRYIDPREHFKASVERQKEQILDAIERAAK